MRFTQCRLLILCVHWNYYADAALEEDFVECEFLCCCAPSCSGIWKLLGRLTDQQKGIIEERLKTVDKDMAKKNLSPGWRTAALAQSQQQTDEDPVTSTGTVKTSGSTDSVAAAASGYGGNSVSEFSSQMPQAAAGVRASGIGQGLAGRSVGADGSMAASAANRRVTDER